VTRIPVIMHLQEIEVNEEAGDKQSKGEEGDEEEEAREHGSKKHV